MMLKKMTTLALALSLGAGTVAPHTVDQVKQAQIALATIHAGSNLVQAACANHFDGKDFGTAVAMSGELASLLATAMESETNISMAGRIAEAVVKGCGFDKVDAEGKVTTKGYSVDMGKKVLAAVVGAVVGEAAHWGAAVGVGAVFAGDQNRIQRRVLRAAAFSTVQATLMVMDNVVKDKVKCLGMADSLKAEDKYENFSAGLGAWADALVGRLMVNAFKEALGEVILQNTSDAPTIQWVEDLKAKVLGSAATAAATASHMVLRDASTGA